MKAIQINKSNKKELEQAYDMDPGELELSSGLYLVSNFGEGKSFMLLSNARYKMLYEETGVIKNGYKSIRPKTAA